MEYAMRKTERAARSVKTQFLIFLVTLFVFLLIFCILLIYTATQACCLKICNTFRRIRRNSRPR